MSFGLINAVAVEPSYVNALAISPDGQLIASGNDAGTVCIYSTRSFKTAYEHYNVEGSGVMAIAWSAIVPSTLIIGNALSQLHVLTLEYQRDDRDRLQVARYGVAQVVEAGVGRIRSVKVYEYLVAVSGDDGIAVKELKPGASSFTSLVTSLPPADAPLKGPFPPPGSIHIYNTETLIATYDGGDGHDDIIAWNMISGKQVWGLKLPEAVGFKGIMRSSLSKDCLRIVSSNELGNGVNWYCFPGPTGAGPAKAVYYSTAEVEADFVAFTNNDKLVVAPANDAGSIYVLDAQSGSLLANIRDVITPSEQYFSAMAVTPEHAFSSSHYLAVAFASSTRGGCHGIKLYKYQEDEKSVS